MNILSPLLLLAVFASSAPGAEWLLVPPGQPVAGTPVEFTLYLNNPGAQSAPIDLPERVPYTWQCAGQSGQDELSWIGPVPATVQPQSFARLSLRGERPAFWSGTVEVRLLEPPSNSVMFLAVPASPTPSSAVEPAALADGTQETDPSSSEYAQEGQDLRIQRYAQKFSPFEPMYFSVGLRDGVNAKFQISFKYRIIDESAWLSRQQPWLNHLYLGYTQTSLWDLDKTSKPFRDTSYRPSFFYFNPQLAYQSDWLARLGLMAGFEHESNGKGGLDSRSINILFIRPVFTLGRLQAYHLTITPKIWYYLGANSENPEIEEYRGFCDLGLSLSKPDGWKIGAVLRKGTEGDYGSVQVDASYPLDMLFFGNFDFYLHLQYFAGWGESLLEYNQKEKSQFRIGFMAIR